MFNLDDVEDLVVRLRAAGIRADLDPAKVNTSGVWVQVAGWQVDTLTTFKTEVRLQLITKDKDSRRATRDLLALLRKVATVVPVRQATARTVLMPDLTGLPGIQVITYLRSPLTPPEQPLAPDAPTEGDNPA